ncbi:MAG TPA: lytic murein transglycosylase [Acetobacteraceae bacterium]|nr:lytic murein transglycosylase [Acetobacteraceae bacterium]
MLTRRLLLIAIPATTAVSAQAAPDSFAGFLVRLRAEAGRLGISAVTLDRALAGLAPNAKVLERDRHQPEFTLTWAQYRALLITDKRIETGRAAVRDNRTLLAAVRARFGVGPAPVAGIWGVESSFGAQTGDFHVVDALATLAWDGRRASFFRPELIAALKILDHGDVTPTRMTGSYAGAMGQPQFMPTSYLRYAVDFAGDGRRDIWTNRADVLASIANYLARSGWRAGQTWGQAVILPAGFGTAAAGRQVRRPLDDWARQGVRPLQGPWRATAETSAAMLLPDGAGGEAFVVYPNFGAIRRYNPSDFYALAVGLLGDTLVA